jgi:pantoate--beta-alanine ligase
MQAQPSLETIRTIAWMKETARRALAESRVIGFVPTMGALHAGHLSLIERAKKDCDPVYASIFVNPKQFGPKEDFAKYPRMMAKDTEKLEAAQVKTLFLPEPAEMYPPEFSTYVNVEGLSDRLEGRTRPGHFRGVTTVVLKLLEIVRPNFAYFGRKDAQQARLISVMARDLNLDTEIVLGPIVREDDGLAMSSRNAYLTPEERIAAKVLHRALVVAHGQIASGERNAQQIQNTLRQVFATEPLAKVDYLEIVDAESFEPVPRVARPCYVLLAAYLGKTRLIDNLFVTPQVGFSDTFVFHL